MSEHIPPGSLQPQLPEAILSVHYDALRPSVRRYVDNLRAQILGMVREYGVADYRTFRALALNDPGQIPREAVEQMKRLLDDLQKALVRNELPAGVSETNLIIPRSINPYYEVYAENDPGRLWNEPQIIEERIDLADVLKQDCLAYERAGLLEWADDLPKTLEGIQWTQEQAEVIEQEIKLGAIPIIMPSAQVQMMTLDRLIFRMSFTTVKEGARQETLCNTRSRSQLRRLINEKNPALVFQVLLQPYFFLTHPIQKPDSSSMDKTLGEQKELLRNLQRSNPYLYAMSVPEYMMLQHRFLERAYRDAEQKNRLLRQLSPIDCLTYTSFIDLPLHPNLERENCVLIVSWDTPEKRLDFSMQPAAKKDPDVGFRFSVRIPLLKSKNTR